MTDWERAHAELSRLFEGACDAPAICPNPAMHGPYAGYKPEVREAPNGDARVDTGKRYLHVAMKYNPPAWARAYLALAHHMACEIAERIGVPDAFYPRIADGTLRVLEYESAAHRFGQESPACVQCYGEPSRDVAAHVCPALAPGAGTAEHTDFDLFTVNLWRSTPEDHEQFETLPPTRGFAWTRGAPAYHLGEIGELVGLGRAVPHRVPARPYTQRALVYFAMPSHGARLPSRYPPGWIAGDKCGGETVGEWLAERMKRSRYT